MAFELKLIGLCFQLLLVLAPTDLEVSVLGFAGPQEIGSCAFQELCLFRCTTFRIALGHCKESPPCRSNIPESGLDF